MGAHRVGLWHNDQVLLYDVELDAPDDGSSGEAAADGTLLVIGRSRRRCRSGAANRRVTETSVWFEIRSAG